MASPVVFLGVGILLLQPVKRFAQYKRLLFLSAGIYIILLGAYSHERSKVWHDTDSLKKELREKLELRKKR
jgi:sulfite exporter TauE/SafE